MIENERKSLEINENKEEIKENSWKTRKKKEISIDREEKKRPWRFQSLLPTHVNKRKG